MGRNAPWTGRAPRLLQLPESLCAACTLQTQPQPQTAHGKPSVASPRCTPSSALVLIPPTHEGLAYPLHQPVSAESTPCSQFGKQIQAEQVPGWSAYYLDYKALKKIISSLADNRPASEAAALAPQSSVRPGDILASPQTPRQGPTSAHESEGPPIYAFLGQDDDRGPSFQAHKAAFFFRLERELEKVRPARSR